MANFITCFLTMWDLTFNNMLCTQILNEALIFYWKVKEKISTYLYHVLILKILSDSIMVCALVAISTKNEKTTGYANAKGWINGEIF